MMNYFQKKIKSRQGFTMIEVIAVLVILGIIAVVAVSRLGTDENDLIAQTDIVKAHLRFAQLKALSDDTSASWGIAFAAGSYALQRNGGAASVNLPGENGATHSFPSGVSITSVTVTPSQTVYFNSWGSPVDASGNLLTANIKITLVQSVSKAFLIYNNTGYIEDTTP